MKSPCRDDRRGGEQGSQKSHHQVLFIALAGDAPGGHEPGWEKKREKRLWPRSEKRGAPQHDAADHEHQENVVHGRARTVERDHSRRPIQRPPVRFRQRMPYSISCSRSRSMARANTVVRARTSRARRRAYRGAMARRPRGDTTPQCAYANSVAMTTVIATPVLAFSYSRRVSAACNSRPVVHSESVPGVPPNAAHPGGRCSWVNTCAGPSVKSTPGIAHG